MDWYPLCGLLSTVKHPTFLITTMFNGLLDASRSLLCSFICKNFVQSFLGFALCLVLAIYPL